MREQRVLVAGRGARLGGRDEAGADPHAVGAERERGGEAAAVEDPAGRDDRHPVAHRVDDLGDERQRRDLAGVTTGLGALRDDDVATGLDRGDRVADLPAHRQHEHRVLVAERDHVARHAEAGGEHRRALADEQLDVGEQAVGQAR